MTPIKYRPDIDGLRAIAVLCVIVYHVAPNRLTGGFVGVDLFFVISGYLISSIIISSIESNSFSYREFYARRIRRIFPALIAILSTVLIAGWFLLLPDEYALLGKHVIASALFSNNFLLWSEAGYFDAQSKLKPLLHLWSLGVEEQFYIFWPIILTALWTQKKYRQSWIALLLLGSLILSAAVNEFSTTAAFFFPFTRFWQLLTGALLAARSVGPHPTAGSHAAGRSNSPASTNRANGKATVGLILILASVFILTSRSPFPMLRALPPTIGAALLISAGPTAYINRSLLASRALVWIGLISYPLYLWHWPLLSFLDILHPGDHLRQLKVLAVATAFALATATYYLIELPLRKSGHGKPIPLIGTAIGCLIAGVTVYAGSGFSSARGPWGVQQPPNRFDQDQMQTAECIAQHQSLFSPNFLFERDFCAGSATSKRDAVVLGDSHAARLFVGLKRVDSTRRYENLGRGSCIPFLRYDASWSATGENLDCATTDERILNSASKYGPGTIILHAYFLRAFSGELRPDAPNDFSSQARDTLNILSRNSRHTVIVLDVPVLTFNPADCIGRPALRMYARTPCRMPRADWISRSRKINEILTSAAESIPNVTVFDPTSTLCDDQYCYATLDGQLLYTDEHHLSTAGATLVAQKLLPYIELDQQLNTRPP